MPLYSKKEFADLCGLSTGNLSNYAKRGKIIYSGDYIDDTLDLNASFLAMRQGKLPKDKIEEKEQKHVVEVKKHNTIALNHQNISPNTIKDQASNAILQLNTQKIETQINKMKMEMEKLRLQNSKFMGEVVPTGLIKPVILQHNQSILTESKNTIDNILRIFAKKHSLDAAEVAEIKSQYIPELNNMIKKASFLTIKAVNNIINDFSEQKGVGEHE